jgi:hypothetical protein
MAYSIPTTPNAHVGHRGGLAQLTNAFFSWELSSDSTADKPIINSLRLNYDEQTWKKQLSQCQPDASDLMIYDPIPAGEVPLLTDKIHSLFSTVSNGTLTVPKAPVGEKTAYSNAIGCTHGRISLIVPTPLLCASLLYQRTTIVGTAARL